MRAPSTSITPQARSARQAAMARWVARGVAIPHDTQDLNLAVKREIWTRGLSIGALSKRMGLTATYLSGVFGACPDRRCTPGLLDRVIQHLHIPAAQARRLHYLAAVEAGWKIRGP